MLYALTTGLCAGIAAGLLLHPSAALYAVLIAASVIFMTFGRRWRRALLVAVFISAAALGIIRADLFGQSVARENLAQFEDRQAVVAGIVSDDPDLRDASLRITIKVATINGEAARGTIIAAVARDEDVSYGDRVEVRGILLAPQAFDAQGGRTFDYPGYLRARGIGAVMNRGELRFDERGGWSLYGTLFFLKHSFERSIEKLLPEPDASLFEGIELGERHGIPSDLGQAFVVSGLVHVVVLSGFNVSIVADAAMRLFSFLPRLLGMSLGGATMILFALMTGAGATTVRACIMASIAILARFLGRPSAAMRALSLAVAAMVLWNPASLLYDPSFILSVLATFGLIAYGGAVDAWLARAWERLRIPQYKLFTEARGTAATTIAVQLFVLPALLFFTGVLSFVSIPANVLALPVVPSAMLLGFFAGLAGLIHPMLGMVPAVITDVLLKWMIWIATSFASLPLSSVIVPAFPAWVAVLAYIPLTALALWVYTRKKRMLPTGDRTSTFSGLKYHS